MENRCVICGEVIPEGRQVCPNCENAKPAGKDETEKYGSAWIIAVTAGVAAGFVLGYLIGWI